MNRQQMFSELLELCQDLPFSLVLMRKVAHNKKEKKKKTREREKSRFWCSSLPICKKAVIWFERTGCVLVLIG